jgi:hypothetical protein
MNVLKRQAVFFMKIKTIFKYKSKVFFRTNFIKKKIKLYQIKIIKRMLNSKMLIILGCLLGILISFTSIYKIFISFKHIYLKRS